MSKVALITGAARRIGRAIALQLHADGYRVVLHFNNSDGEAEALAGELNAKRADSAIVCKMSLLSHTADNSPLLSERCDAMVQTCFEAFSRLDVLVNNASAYYPTPLLESGEKSERDATAAEDIFGSNALAPFYLSRSFARRCTDAEDNKRNNRCIVNMVDAMAAQPLLSFTMYTMGKHALEGLIKSSALELAAVHIRVNGVGPGISFLPVEMPLEEHDVYRSKIPLDKREATGEEIANAVSFLASDKASYVTGTTVKVDGGWSLTRA